jgi:two-component system chemotaxis sensor kinase CheA
MALDLTQFHDTFFEESYEALDSMESALLNLNDGTPDPENINTIFRVAHSMKGGSATFGFTEIASFTHSLETRLDELRGGRLGVTRAIHDKLLKSVDVMREMLRSVQSKKPIDMQSAADLQFDLELIVAQKNSAPVAAATSPNAPAPTPTAPDAPVQSVATAVGAPYWHISFVPHEDMLDRGNDPVRLLRELEDLGRRAVHADLARLPPLRELDPHCCYISWSLEIEGSVAEHAIREVFDWVDGDCELEIERVDPTPDERNADAAPVSKVAETTVPASSTIPAPAVAAVPVSSPAVPPRADAASGGGGGGQGGGGQGGGKSGGDASSIRVSVEKIDELMNTVSELVITQAMLAQISRTIDGAPAEHMRTGLAQLERNMRELQESVMRVRMLPISFVFSRFPRMVHDLAQRLGKQIELKISGDQTELDKTVLEKIGDPLVHLVRNSVDHGVEMPAARIAAGKPATGTVHLDACHRGGNIAVEVSDDGGGLDGQRILAKARERGLVGPNDVLSDEQIYELIFMPGFSTAEKTTDVSGRGVGMDVVRRNVKALGGNIEIRSQLGRGSRFIITLPLTLAIVDGQSVRVGAETYIVPLVSIVESLQVNASDVSRLSGAGEVFAFRGDYLPIIRLHEVFDVEPRTRSLNDGLVVVAEGDGRRVGLFVDDLLGQQQVVIKSLETNYGHVEGVSGATILGDGSVALILDLAGLIRATSAQRAAA